MQLEDIDESSWSTAKDKGKVAKGVVNIVPWTGATALPRRETKGHDARPASAAAACSVILNGDSQTLQTVNIEVESDCNASCSELT